MNDNVKGLIRDSLASALNMSELNVGSNTTIEVVDQTLQIGRTSYSLVDGALVNGKRSYSSIDVAGSTRELTIDHFSSVDDLANAIITRQQEGIKSLNPKIAEAIGGLATPLSESQLSSADIDKALQSPQHRGSGCVDNNKGPSL